uniref:Copine C-terminal domain-containing protein n=1 Tax=Ascaris lumbricoides TaxID=6252 RepID=A0A9J2PTG5_ASCLU
MSCQELSCVLHGFQIRNFLARSSFPIAAGNIIGSAIFKLDELIGAFGAQLCKVIRRNFLARSSFPIAAGNIIGSAIFKLDELIGAFGAQLCKVISSKATIASALSVQTPSVPVADYRGTLIVTGRLAGKAEPVILQFAGRNLERKGKFFDETEVYFQIHRAENNDERTLLYQSESIKNHSHPIWKSFTLQMKQIADHRNRLLEVSVLYRDEVDNLGFIGSFLTSYAKMKYGPGPENIYNVVNHKKLTKKGYVNSGKLELIKFTDVSFYSFLDYITSGTQLHLAVAFDFSVRQRVREEAQWKIESDFQLALRAIGEIVRDYSSSKLFPALGVGAKIPPTFYDSQEFCMNFDTDPCCRGIDGILEAYKKAARIVVPIENVTYFHIIHYVAKMAMNSGAKGLHYYILTIFTQGGPIRDLKELLDALAHASKAPLSVIFVGIGDGDFDDFYRLTSKRQVEAGKKREREIVEFLDLNSVLDRDECAAHNKRRIAEQALHIVPWHLVSYMHRNNIAAKPPIQFLDLNSVLDRDECAAHNKRRIAEQALHIVPWHLVSYMHRNNIAAKPPIQISRSPVFHASYLIPDHPSSYDDEEFENRYYISRSPVFHASYLIPDHPSSYDDEEFENRYYVRPKSSTPCSQRPLSGRIPAPRPNRANSAIDDSIELRHFSKANVPPTFSNYLSVKGAPYRSHSAIQTSRDEIQRQITQRQAFRTELQAEATSLDKHVPLLLVEGLDENAFRTPNRANSAIDDSIELRHFSRANVPPTFSNYLSVKGAPYRSHSAIQTSRDEIQRQITQRQAFRTELQAEATSLDKHVPLLLVEGLDENAFRTRSRVARIPGDIY